MPEDMPLNDPFRLAVPSDGAMHQITLDFLRDCGMNVQRPSPRRYTATVSTIPGGEVIFQRTADITWRVEAGNADLGIVGFDRYQETRIEGGASLLIMNDLGFGRCDLVVAAPEAWLDVTAMSDLADIAVEFRETSRELRVATKYPRLVRRFFYAHGINYFSIAPVSGTLEAAPAMGFADLIVDVTASGVTLKENHLRRLTDGTVMTSEGAVIGNRELLRRSPDHLAIAREIVTRIEARRSALRLFGITANIAAPDEQAVSARLMEFPAAAGLHGPTIAPVHNSNGKTVFAATVFVERNRLAEVREHLSVIGATSVSVSEPNFVFDQDDRTFNNLKASLGLK